MGFVTIRFGLLLGVTVLAGGCGDENKLAEGDDTGQVPEDTGKAPDDTGQVPEDTGKAPDDTGQAPGDTCASTEDTGPMLEDTAPPPTLVSVADLAVAKLIGEAPEDLAGTEVAAGDLTGDGRIDLLVGAPAHDDDHGRIYVMAAPVSGTLDLATAPVILDGTGTWSTGTVMATGDTDGDGFTDLLIGDDHDIGASLLRGPLTSGVAPDLASTNYEREYSNVTSVALADFDGDGLDDLAVGDPGPYSWGTASVFLSPTPAVITEADAAAILTGESPDHETGEAIAAGDVDGDGLADLLIGAREAGDETWPTGRIYLVLGPPLGNLSWADADSTFRGVSDHAAAGRALAMGDVDGDGRADLVVGAPWGARGGWVNGAVYVVERPCPGEHSLNVAQWVLIGTQEYDIVGSDVAAGDVDGDGRADLLVGDSPPRSSRNEGTSSYLLLSPGTGVHSMASADARLGSETGSDRAGRVALGDLDADGRADLLIGAPWESTGAARAGAVYVVPGLLF